MPIRAEERARYPANWPAIAKAIKDAAGWTCVGSPAFPDCRARHGQPHPVTGSNVIITVAHLDHRPENCDTSNLRAWCQRCHNTYDAPKRALGKKARRQMALVTLADVVERLMVEQGKTCVWLADHALLKDAYLEVRGPCAGQGIRQSLKAVAQSSKFEKAGFIKAPGFSARECRHPVYRLKRTAAEAQT